MNSIFEPSNIDTVLGVFTKTLAKLDMRAGWLQGERVRLTDELNRINDLEGQYSTEARRITKVQANIQEIVGG